MRHRTDEIPIREMTYLFVIIALPVMNSVLMAAGSFTELVVRQQQVARDRPVLPCHHSCNPHPRRHMRQPGPPMHFRAHGDRGDRRQGVDSYFGSDDGKMLHNYYLHNDPASGQLAWISWDHSMVLGSSDCLRGQRERCQTKIDWRRRPSIDAWQRCGPSSSIWHPRNLTSLDPIQSTGEDMA